MIIHALLALAASAAPLATPAPATAEAGRLDRLAARICGPDGTVDMDPVPDRRGRYHVWPHCSRYGWNGRRYVPLCEGSKPSPRRTDPWLNAYSDARLEDRRITLSDERTNSCD